MNETSLDGSLKWATVAQAQEHIVREPPVELVEDNCLLAVVIVPPDLSVLVGTDDNVGVWMVLKGGVGLAASGLAPVDKNLGLDGSVTGCGSNLAQTLDSAVVSNVGKWLLLGDLLKTGAGLDEADNSGKVRPVILIKMKNVGAGFGVRGSGFGCHKVLVSQSGG